MLDDTQRKPTLRSQLKLEKWITKIPPGAREELIESNCGTTAGYVLKRVYTHDYDLVPTFKFKIAVGLDKASQGQVDLRDFIEGSEEIDWAYVSKVLNRRLREEAAALKATTSDPA